MKRTFFSIVRHLASRVRLFLLISILVTMLGATTSLFLFPTHALIAWISLVACLILLVIESALIVLDRRLRIIADQLMRRTDEQILRQRLLEASYAKLKNEFNRAHDALRSEVDTLRLEMASCRDAQGKLVEKTDTSLANLRRDLNNEMSALDRRVASQNSKLHRDLYAETQLVLKISSAQIASAEARAETLLEESTDRLCQRLGALERDLQLSKDAHDQLAQAVAEDGVRIIEAHRANLEAAFDRWTAQSTASQSKAIERLRRELAQMQREDASRIVGNEKKTMNDARLIEHLEERIAILTAKHAQLEERISR